MDTSGGGDALFRLDEVLAPGPAAAPPGERGRPGEPFRARVTPGLHGRGPWDFGLLHGGPVGGIAAWAAERAVPAADGLICARLTVELLSGVPLAPMEVMAEVAKPGRRSRVVDVRLTAGDRTVMRASSQWVVPSTGWETPHDGAPPRPAATDDPGALGLDYPRPGFNCDAVELRFVSGSTEESGPGVVWSRLRVPLMEGEEPSPLVRTGTLADLAAAVGWEHGEDVSFINPDITLQLGRYPRGEWVCVAARNHRSAGAVAFNEATFYDDEGPFGRVLQTLVESAAPIGGNPPA